MPETTTKMDNNQVTDGCNVACGRMTGKGVLKQRIEDLRRTAASLETIHDMLPEKPTPEQDAAIWQFACNIPR